MSVGIAVSSADDLDDEFGSIFFNLTGESVENTVDENDNFFQAVRTFSVNLYEVNLERKKTAFKEIAILFKFAFLLSRKYQETSRKVFYYLP